MRAPVTTGARFLEVVMAPLVVNRARRCAAPPAVWDLQSLVEPLRARPVLLHAELIQFQYAEASSEDRTSAGELIQGGGLRGYVPGELFRERREHCSQVDPLCTHGNRRQFDPGGHPVIGKEGAVPASMLRFMG